MLCTRGLLHNKGIRAGRSYTKGDQLNGPFERNFDLIICEDRNKREIRDSESILAYIGERERERDFFLGPAYERKTPDWESVSYV